MQLTQQSICEISLRFGFDACGVAEAHRLEADAMFMDTWVAAGYHGKMDYLERNCEKRYDPRELVAGAKFVVVCLLTYDHSGRDYHRTMKSKLYEMEGYLKQIYGEDIVSQGVQHIFCDSAPMLERRWATLAGLGFIGKNHQLIHPVLGSKVHIGELVLNADVVMDGENSPMENGCGDCRLCIEACPRGALGNTFWDARRCVAYETHRCEICQIKCPYNEKTQ